MRTPSLDLWRRELAAKQRTTDTFDALWRAACAEVEALEFLGHGLPWNARTSQARAGRIVLDALREQRRRVA